MKYLLLSVLALLLALPAAGGVRWLGTVHDFGAFDEDDGRQSCTFSMVNEGPEAVSIVAARASCGCTTPRFTKTPIAPGDTAVVDVTFNPVGRPGRFSKTVNIDLSAGPRTTLTIRGVVIGSSNTLRSRYPIDAGPVKLRTRALPFGTVLKGKAKSTFLEFYNATSEPVTPRVEQLPTGVKVSASRATIPAGEQAVYTFTLTPGQTQLYGIMTDSVQLIPSAGVPPVTIELTAILEEDFTLLTPGQRAKAPVMEAPERVDFGEFEAEGEPLTRSFEVRNTGRSDLLLRRVYTLDPGVSITAPSKVKKGGTATISVTVDPRQLPAPLLNARIQLIANDPENPIAIVRAVGIPK